MRKHTRWLTGIILALLTAIMLVGAALADTTYIVRAGDTLSRIARQFNTTVDAIARANNLVNPNYIYVGQLLTIPTSGGGGGGGGGATATPVPPPVTPPPGTGVVTYVVRGGDTLSRIASRFGVTLNDLIRANNITNPNYIYVGQVLRIPNQQVVVPPAPQPTATPRPAQPTATPRPAQPTPAPTQPPPRPNTGFELGGQTQSFANPGTMRDIGMTWVKFQFKWQPSDRPDAVAQRIRDGHAAGFKVLLSMPGINTYPSAIDFAAYVEFLRGVASLPEPPDAIEIWNEMNIDFEWPVGQINPQQYVDAMLRPGYQAIKGANPNILVIGGAPAPTGFDNGSNAWADDRYIRGMAAAGAASYMDCMGVHHNAGATSPNASTGHPGGSHYSWYFFPTFNLYYNAFGGAVPICFTELGYVTGEDYGGSLPPNFAWGNGTSLAEHTQWLGEAVTAARNSGRVRLLILFNVDFTYYDPNGDPQAGYALIRRDGSCPACANIRAAMGR